MTDTNKQWRLMSDEISSLRSANAELKAEVKRLKKENDKWRKYFEFPTPQIAAETIVLAAKQDHSELTRLRSLLEEIKEESSTCGFCDSAVIASKGKVVAVTTERQQIWDNGIAEVVRELRSNAAEYEQTQRKRKAQAAEEINKIVLD
jgi:hypothetical protein